MPPTPSSKTFPTKSLPSARRVAALTVYASLYKNQDLQSALDQILSQESLSARDKGLATELAYGYIRNKKRVDFLVTSFLKSPEHLPSRLLLVLVWQAMNSFFWTKFPPTPQ
jgi:16S rRNA (cytosine967-C5)-methyltransferase